MAENADYFNRKENEGIASGERENSTIPKMEFSKKFNCIEENHFGRSLREIRNSLNLTQMEASNLINVTQAQWSAYELGKTKPSIDTILNISDKLKIDPFLLVNKTIKKFIYFKENNEEECGMQHDQSIELEMHRFV
jgi:transcriptional regulator with XRE-family HTH domain